MNNILNKIKKDFYSVSDLKIKKIKKNIFNKIYIIYLETICDSNKINNYILKYLVNNNLNDSVPGPNTVSIKEKEIEFYLTNGFAIVINNNKIIAIEVKGEISRSINTSTREPSLLGPEDAFNENYQTNLGLIKRRIKTKSFKTEEIIIGKRTKTKIGICYIEDIIDKNNLNIIKDRLNKINIDGIVDAGNIINYLEDENNSVFPTIRRTERPDVTVNSLLEGKIILLIDTSPFSIILPTFLVDFINPASDNYVKSINVSFIKILRFICFFLSISLPGFFIAITNFDQETIPADLLVNLSKEQSGVPFPAIIELLILLIVCDILRESDLRFPSNFGSTISILGALIIGEAAVNAGIVSPIMIIITSLTFIASLIFTDLEFNNALRYYRYLFLFSASFLGLYGLFLCTMFLLINVISLKSLKSPYFIPIAPFNKEYFFKTVLKNKEKNNTLRSGYISNNDLTKGKIK